MDPGDDPWTQWAAVTTHLLETIVPPQNGVLLFELVKATCHGSSFLAALTPPTMRFPGLTPQLHPDEGGDGGDGGGGGGDGGGGGGGGGPTQALAPKKNKVKIRNCISP